jgi:dTMP kinase
MIAIEGIDQSGKRTQARILADHLKRIGTKPGIISFPIYDSPSGRQIRHYLRGKRDYSPQALHMLYSLNRWENQTVLGNLLEKADFVIADRYTPSNLAYGVARGLELDWLLGLDKGLPASDLVIVLDVPTHSSFARKAKNRDVHERDERFLTSVRRSYSALAGKLGWKKVPAAGQVQEVHAVIWNLVRRRFNLVHRVRR